MLEHLSRDDVERIAELYQEYMDSIDDDENNDGQFVAKDIGKILADLDDENMLEIKSNINNMSCDEVRELKALIYIARGDDEPTIEGWKRLFNCATCEQGYDEYITGNYLHDLLPNGLAILDEL